MLHGLSSRRSWKTVDILCNKEYNYGLVIMDYHTTTNTNHTIKENNMLEYIPENLDFDVTFEPTRVADKKYVIDNNTGEPIAIVGKDFTCASHGDFFRQCHGHSDREPFLT